MSIGLAVDYTAHYLHAFMSTASTDVGCVQDGNARMMAAFQHIATPVFSGGFTTWLGVVPLFFSTSMIFGTFFKMFCGIIGFGVVHGLIFAPAVISLFNPKLPADL